MAYTFDDIQTSLSAELARLNDCISAALSAVNPLLNDVVGKYLEKKGKQIRPMVVFLTARMLGKVNDDVVNAATAVELLHNATLIHDDVVDETKMRRNNPTINALWDNRIAVLVGDFFLSSALYHGYRTGHVRVIESLSTLGRKLSMGELDQIHNARHHIVDEDAYFAMIFHKTASLFESCMEVACYTAGASDEQLEQLREYGRLLGLCFQMRDDVFDYFSDELVGKPTGNDLREGKLTLPLIHVLADASLPQHNEMIALIERDALTAEQIATLTAYARSNGGIDYAYAKMNALRDRAAELLSHFPDCEERNQLLALLDFIIVRKF